MAATLNNRAPIGSLLKGSAPSRKPAKARRRNDEHLRFIRSLPCIISKVEGRTEAAHLRFADPGYDKPITGIGTKAHDHFVLPLSTEMHREQHAHGDERAWWASKGIVDPLKLCLRLFVASGDEVEARKIIAGARA